MFDEDLIPMICWLSSILFIIIGGFWLLDSLKDTVFASIVGLEHQPWAKFCSVMFTLLLTLGYNALVDRVAKPTLFYLVGLAYTIIFLTIAVMLANPRWGIQNEEASPGEGTTRPLSAPSRLSKLESVLASNDPTTSLTETRPTGLFPFPFIFRSAAGVGVVPGD
jgi:hypothetical protein